MWHMLVGAVGLIVGLLPHVLHHIGLLAGTALVAGSGGTALFGALGLLASIPMLVRLYRRFGSWVAPALGLLVFAAMFSLSAFVIGPAISGTGPGVNPGPNPPWTIRATTRALVTDAPIWPGNRGGRGTWPPRFLPAG
nr:hypothetical protein GCM10017547_34950 [Pseudarthrobacter oxydans]